MNDVVTELNAIADRIKVLAAGLDQDRDIILDVPYLSQWGPTADKRRGDCGPATVAMCAHYAGQDPTVDEAAAACKQPRTGRGSYFTSVYQLKDGAKVYGMSFEIRAPHNTPPLTLNLLKRQVDKGCPSICLICYKTLRELTNSIDHIIHNQDQSYNFGHFVLFVGYGPGGVFVHDPNFWSSRRDDGNARFIPVDPFYQSLITPAMGNSYGSQGLTWSCR